MDWFSFLLENFTFNQFPKFMCCVHRSAYRYYRNCLSEFGCLFFK